MDDYQTYLNALQSSNYITQLNEFNQQMANSKKEADTSTGSILTSEGIREGITKVVGAIRTKISDTASDLVNTATDTVKTAISSAKDAATEAAQGAIKQGQQIITEGVQTGQQALADATEGIIQEGQQITSGLIGDVITSGMQSINNIPTQEEALSMLSQQSRPQPTSDLLPEGAGQIEGELPSAIAPAVDTQLTALHAQAMDNAFGAIQSRTGTQITGGYEELSQSSGPRFNQLSTDVSDEFEEMGDILGGATNRLLSGSIRFTPQINTVASDTLQGAQQQISSAIQPLMDTASETIDQGINGAQSALSAVSESATSSISSLTSTASGAIDAASEAVSTGFKSASTAVDSTINAVSDALTSGVDTAVSAATGAATGAIDAVAGAATAGVEAAAGAVGATVGGIFSELGPIGLLLGGLAGGIVSLVEGAKEHATQAPVLNPAFQFL